MLSQLMWVFGFFSLVLVLVYWVNRAVSLFDQLIANGHSAFVFLEFTALSLPNVIRIVLPVSAFAAAVYVTNRMASESELVVVQSTGYSPWRMARPVMVFGLVVAAMISVLSHVLIPASTTQLAARTAEISENVTARLLSEGEFLHPADGVTFYIREITPEGELRDIFLSDARKPDQRSIYTAERALLLRSDAGPKLLMFQGMVQNLDLETDRLATTRFAEFAFDVSALVDLPTTGPRGTRELSTAELLSPTAALAEETGQSMNVLRYEGHGRITEALLGLVTPVVGFAVLLLGGFSRFGVWKQIVGAIVCLIAIQLADNAVTDAARSRGLWPMAYLPALFGLALAAVFLWLAAHPRAFRRKSAQVTP
nr:LPS export ABC transporter permease LptF [Oceaniglobus trochenteri]